MHYFTTSINVVNLLAFFWKIVLNLTPFLAVYDMKFASSLIIPSLWLHFFFYKNNFIRTMRLKNAKK